MKAAEAAEAAEAAAAAEAEAAAMRPGMSRFKHVQFDEDVRDDMPGGPALPPGLPPLQGGRLPPGLQPRGGRPVPLPVSFGDDDETAEDDTAGDDKEVTAYAAVRERSRHRLPSVSAVTA